MKMYRLYAPFFEFEIILKINLWTKHKYTLNKKKQKKYFKGVLDTKKEQRQKNTKCADNP